MKSNFYMSHWITLLFFATLLVVFFSWIGSIYGLPVQSLLSPEGIRWMLRHVDENLCQAPFASAFVLLVGMGLAYASGLFDALRQYMRRISLHKSLSKKQKRALLLSLASGSVCLLFVGIATLSPSAILLGVTGTFERSPFVEGIVPIVSCLFFVVGLVFGIASGQFRNDRDIIRGVGSLLVEAVNYFVFLLVASQFLGILHYSQIDKYMGIGETETAVLHLLLYYLPFVGIFVRRNG